MDHARSHLLLARKRLAGLRLEHLCFHAQQAAEKVIEALMVRYGIEFAT